MAEKKAKTAEKNAGHPAKAHLSRVRRREQGDQVRRLRPQGLLPGLREELRLRRPHALSGQGDSRWAERARARPPSATSTLRSAIWRTRPTKMPTCPRTKPAGAKSSASTPSCSASASRSCAGRILNRERINKTIEGIYFICATCLKVCHSLDDGLSEDPANQNNLCGACAKAQAAADSAAAAAAIKESGGPSRRATRSRRKRAAAS